MRYTAIEYTINSFLRPLPGIQKIVKTLYNTTNYFLYGSRNFRYRLHPKIRMQEAIPTTIPSFFGYYDYTPWNRAMTDYLLHLGSGKDVAIARYNILRNTIRIIDHTMAWNFQQGSRLSWIPPSNNIIYNTIYKGKLQAKVKNRQDATVKMYSKPIQCVSPQGRKFLSINYHRLQYQNPDYAYQHYASRTGEDEEGGIWIVDMDTGNVNLLYTMQQLKQGANLDDMESRNIEINHLAYSPNGARFAGIMRYRNGGMKISRLFLGDIVEQRLQFITRQGYVSHYSWIDNHRLVLWGNEFALGKGYYIINLNYESPEKNKLEALGDAADGHPAVSPDQRWIVFDTYPDRQRIIRLKLFDLLLGEVIELGEFFSPIRYQNRSRCDLHPRWSPDGKQISIDSTHSGTRSNYILDVTEIVET